MGKGGRARRGERVGKDGRPLSFFYCYYDHKRSWRSRKAVDDVVAQLRRRDPDEPSRPYWCPKAGAWHITTGTAADYDRRQVMSNGKVRTDMKVPVEIGALPARGAPLAEQHVRMTCTCGEPIELDLSGDVRKLPAGGLDPAAELITLVVKVRHHEHNRVEGFGMYVVTPVAEEKGEADG